MAIVRSRPLHREELGCSARQPTRAPPRRAARREREHRHHRTHRRERRHADEAGDRSERADRIALRGPRDGERRLRKLDGDQGDAFFSHHRCLGAAAPAEVFALPGRRLDT
jgi:hypothetical protein